MSDMEEVARFTVGDSYTFCFECGFHGIRSKDQGPCCESEAPRTYEVLSVDTVKMVVRVGKI